MLHILGMTCSCVIWSIPSPLVEEMPDGVLENLNLVDLMMGIALHKLTEVWLTT